MEVELVYAEAGRTHRLVTSLAHSDKMSKFKELVMRELGLSSPNSFSLIDQATGVDFIFSHPDEQIAPEKRKQMTFYVFNDQVTSESQLRKLLQDVNERQAAEQALEQHALGSLTDLEITTPYVFSNFSSSNPTELQQLQTIERANFTTYQEILKTFKSFKSVSSRCQKELALADTLLNKVEPALKESVRKTFDELSSQRSQLEQRLQTVRDGKDEILSMYRDGIAAIKRYELHPKLCKEPGRKQHLIDIYYAESSMDNFRKNCVAQLEKITSKMDELKKDFQFKYPQLINISMAVQTPDHLYEQLSQSDEKIKRELIEDQQPLLQSLLMTVGEDLKALHSQLDKIKISNQVDPMLVIQCMTKQGTHARLLMEAVDYMRQADLALKEILRLKEAICIHVYSARQHLQPSRLLKGIITLKDMKNLKDNLESQQKDFLYLKKPAQVPQAYEQALVEMVRRKEFRTILDADVATLRAFIKQEQEKRRDFSKHVHTYLPSQFCPQLRDQVPELALEGTASEYSFADVRDAVKGYEPLVSPFSSKSSTTAEGVSAQQEEGVSGARGFARRPSSVAAAAQAEEGESIEGTELRKELNLRQEEYSSNLREKEATIQKLQIQLQVKDDQLKKLGSRLTLQEADTAKAVKQLEDCQRTIRELSAQFIRDSKMDQQALARKTKELETVLREKKCTNCILCVEDMKPSKIEAAQLQAQITLLNDNLVSKTCRISELEESQRQSQQLVSQICQHNYRVLLNKASEFMRQQDTLKSRYENKLMQVEDQLSSETQKCAEVIKARIAPLQEKIDKLRKQESKLKQDEAEQKVKLRELTAQVKLKDEQVQFYKKEAGRKGEEKQEYTRQIKEIKAQLVEASASKAQTDDELAREKQSRTVEASDLRKQIRELTESSEAETRQKNDKIKRLQEECESLKKEHRAQLERVSDSSRDQAELQGLRDKLENERQRCASKDEAIEAKRVELLEIKALAKKTKDELQQKGALVQNANSKVEDCKQQISHLETQNARVKKAIASIINDQQQVTVPQEQSTVQAAGASGNQQDDFSWEAGLLHILRSSKRDTINFRAVNFNGLGMVTGVASDNRLLFMPHSEGIYMALVLKNADDLEREQEDQLEMMSHISSQTGEDSALSPIAFPSASDSDASSSKSKAPPVQRLYIENHLFLDLSSLSKSFQTILTTYQMLVIARVGQVYKQVACAESNPYELGEGTIFYQCQIESIENIVGFEDDRYGFTNYQCAKMPKKLAKQASGGPSAAQAQAQAHQ